MVISPITAPQSRANQLKWVFVILTFNRVDRLVPPVVFYPILRTVRAFDSRQSV